MATTSRSSRRGMTVIELVVVIAIISILVALLVPAAMRIKEHARLMYCQTILRSLGTAYHSYATDWKGQIVPMVDSPITPVLWHEVFKAYGGAELAKQGFGSKQDAFIECPKYKPQTGHSSYAQNQFVGYRDYSGRSTLFPTSFSHINAPAEMVLMGEHEDWIAAPNWWSDLGKGTTDCMTPHFGDQTPTGRWKHGQANFLYCDGHVEPISWQNNPLLEENFLLDINIYQGDRF